MEILDRAVSPENPGLDPGGRQPARAGVDPLPPASPSAPGRALLLLLSPRAEARRSAAGAVTARAGDPERGGGGRREPAGPGRDRDARRSRRARRRAGGR